MVKEILLAISAVVLCVVIIISYFRGKRREQKYQQQLIEDRQKIWKDIYDNERSIMMNDIMREMKELENHRATLVSNINYEIEKIKGARLNEVNAFVEERKRIRELELQNWDTQKQNEISARLQKCEEDYSTKIAQLTADLQKLQSARDHLQAEVDIINAENHKLELEQNEIDMHRIILSDAAKDDLAFLDSITHKLHNPEILYKLMWSEYIQKPFQQMIKNIFGTDIPKNVIYCIENLENHKKYIGKTSAEVSKRWTEHVKSSLNIGSIAHANIHDVLYLNWDNFYFSIIEKVDSDQKLSDKEKFYIDFYKSNTYGYNMKVG